MLIMRSILTKQPYDMFDFDPGRTYPPELIAPLISLYFDRPIPAIKFDEMNLLKKCDGAADYTQSASWKRSWITSGSNLPDDLDALDLETNPSPFTDA
jgi:hypothetical protein